MLAQFTVRLTTASIPTSLDCNSAQGSSRGGLHFQLIYNLQNTVSCALEKVCGNTLHGACSLKMLDMEHYNSTAVGTFIY